MNPEFLRKRTCCFTGHRAIPSAEMPIILERLERCLESLITQGVVYFGCGGARGFDMLAGQTVLELKDKHPQIRLIMVLPCENQDARWTGKEKVVYRQLLTTADKRVYISKEYDPGCMARRNLHLVEHSAHCIAYLRHPRSGTAQTVRMAKEHERVVHLL